MIAGSIQYLRAETGKPVFYDAEHFDGFVSDEEYALDTLRAARRGWQTVDIVRHQWGMLPSQIVDVSRVADQLPTQSSVYMSITTADSSPIR